MTFAPTDYQPYDFANRRHIGPSPAEMAQMLKVVGAANLEALIDDTVPQGIRQDDPLDFGAPMSEQELLVHMRAVSKKNKVLTSLIGQGYHATITPPAIKRNIFENPAWYTAYTPYQPEISQGRLEALLNYQTMISDLTGLPIANASLLDEATAAAEAMTMAQRSAKSKATAFFVDEALHPQNIAVIRTRAKPLGIEIIIGRPSDLDAEAVFGAVFQYPGSNGVLRDFAPQMQALHAARAIGIVIADPLALCVLKEPGAMGADIAVGSTQRFGVPVGYGGPHAAYMACKDELKRSMPGRLVGVSIDARGNRAYRLALQTREQHIRREKATSNVCTAQALLAVMASMYAVFHGPKGLKAIAQRVHAQTVDMAAGLRAAGFDVFPKRVFDTLTVDVGPFQATILKSAREEGINLRRVGDTRIGISLDECTTPAVIESVWRAFGVSDRKAATDPVYDLPEALVRESDYLTHDIFHMNRAETEMMRYMRRLSDRDLALDRAMIPLGSCTMKLNAATEMIPVSWDEFAALHPFCPPDQAQGYAEMINDLSAKLCDVTGYAAFSMQPNSGAQGEYAGLLSIAGFHAANGAAHRNVCLIPTSAHGTNPAS
ncbi:aminomethyl-transferring glycine dehydrogenase subunit GcvPA, partial [Pseudooceanicola sp.]|uniref:aminomethyl-transferring glycine dehydrogenase subunit GcvPA n=1 Tax=Pseudooceanicola sp. TaxID=1914328 RepID=UPI00261AD397